ncbi:MAG: SIMPL domain-containing protein [Caulobacter sp.]|nr:SIMPL domain-containing protein [Caulobacter sp.]
MKALFRAAAVSALLVAGTVGIAGAASAQTVATSAADSMFRATTLNLSAYGEVRQRPDQATISMGVTTEAPTAAEAMRLNAVKMNQVIAALKKGGIADRDIQTSGLSLNPQYVYVENQPPRLSGYQASNTVTVVVRDLTKLGQAVDATVNAGATNIGGISFGLQDASAAEDAARIEAARALQARAELYARAMGYRVGRLVTLSEGGGYSPPPPMPVYAMAGRMEKDSSTPVEAGEMKVRIDVSATFELVK